MVAAMLLALALHLAPPLVCSTPDGLTVWIEDDDCGGWWEVCQTGDFVDGAKVRACCLLAAPGVCRLAMDGTACLGVERHRCDLAL